MRPRSSGDHAGFTVVELLVAIFLAAIVLLVAYKGLSELQASAAGTQERFTNLDEARLLMDTVTRDLRTAIRLTSDTSPFTSATARQVTFYANIATGTGPHRLNIFVDPDGRLVEEDVAPQGIAPNYTYTTPPTVRAVAGTVATTGTIFTYFDSAGSVLPAPLSASNLLRIDAVEVTISIRQSSAPGIRPVTLVNRVRLPNVEYRPLGT